MLKHLEVSSPGSCLNNAGDDEPIFVIRAKDACAAAAVLAWVRLADGVHEDWKRREARLIALRMELWRLEQGIASGESHDPSMYIVKED